MELRLQFLDQPSMSSRHLTSIFTALADPTTMSPPNRGYTIFGTEAAKSIEYRPTNNGPLDPVRGYWVANASRPSEVQFAVVKE